MPKKALQLRPQKSIAVKDSDVPAVIAAAGDASRYAYEEFIFGEIRNKNTRLAYKRAVTGFLTWVENRGLALPEVAPKDIHNYFETLESIPKKKLHRSALNRFFDFQVVRHAVIINPVASVRVERYQITEGLTPEITIKQAKQLFNSIPRDSVIGLRDHAIIGILAYTGSRVGAVAKLKRRHLTFDGDQWVLAFTEKGGKIRKIPVRHDLKNFIFAYLDKSGITEDDKNASLFPKAIGRMQNLSREPMAVDAMTKMFKRRARKAGLPPEISPHSFRVTTITSLLEQGVPLEDVQYLANHADPRTTRLYDRRKRKVTRNIVERIPTYENTEG